MVSYFIYDSKYYNKEIKKKENTIFHYYASDFIYQQLF